MPMKLRCLIVIFIVILGFLLFLNVSHTSAQATQPADFKPELQAAITQFLIDHNFTPGTTKQASIYLRDLSTDESFIVNGGKAYSAVSLTKVAVMIGMFRKLSIPPTVKQATVLANMMVCSENGAADTVIKFDGDDNTVHGLTFINDTLAALGLTNTVLLRQFYDVPNQATSTLPPAPTTDPTIDFHETMPDPYNHTTPDEIGTLLGDIYHCAIDGSGPLTTAFPGEITMPECRAMVRVMKDDQLDVQLEGGVPVGTIFAQKTGAGNDIRDDIAIIMTPGGDYVLVAMFRQKTYLSVVEVAPLMAEISRMVYNSYNPTMPMKKIRDRSEENCQVNQTLIDDLQKPDQPPIR